MSEELRPERRPSTASWRRMAILVALLIGQGLVLNDIFHLTTARQALPLGWWTYLLIYSHFVMPLGAIFGTAIFLVAGSRLRRIIVNHPPVPDNRLGALLIAQLAVFAAFFALTAVVFRPIQQVIEYPGCWVGVWLAVAVLTMSLWVFALLPARALLAIVAQAWGLLLCGAALGLAAWGMGYFTQPYWWSMQTTALNWAHAILLQIDPTAFTIPSQWIIGAGDFSVRISAECSGYEGIGLEVVFLSAYLWLFRQRLRFPQVLILLPAATIAVWIANLLRIVLLVYIGAHFSPAVAVGGFHSYAGIVLFLAVSIFTIVLAEHTPFFCKDTVAAVSPRRSAAAPFLLPFMAATAAKLITGLFSPGGHDPLYPLSVLAAAAVLLWYRRDYPRPRLGAPFAGLAAGLIVFVIWILPIPHKPAAHAQPVNLAPAFIFWLICRCIGYIVVTPIIEELAFRGYLARRLVSADYQSVRYQNLTPLAIGISSLAFAALHGSEWIAAFFAGAAFALVARRKGNLTDAVLAHAVANGLLAAFALASGDLSLFS